MADASADRTWAKLSYVMNLGQGKEKGTYFGSTEYSGDCYTSSGKVLMKNAYTYAETINIKPTRSLKGQTTAFTGSLILGFDAKSPKIKARCPDGYISIKLTSLKKTG